jgi:RHS repeat-associated protein
MIREADGSRTNDYAYGLDLSGSPQGAGTIGGLLMGTLDGTNAFYCYDANGNVTELVDGGGNTVAAYRYDPFGNTIGKSGALADANPFRFSTKYLDGETDLYYYGYRFYTPKLGRWVNSDPVGEVGGLNCIAFLENATVSRIDLLGQWGYDVHYGWTRAWAVSEGYQEPAAIAVAEADDAVDTTWDTSPLNPLGQKYHFDRSGGGVDSRLERFVFHFDEAKKWCDWKTYGDLLGDVPDRAAFNLGSGLHPRQDWVAHGDYGIWTPGMAPWHNWASLQWGYWTPAQRAALPDRFDLDARFGPNGRPAGSGIILDSVTGGYAFYGSGSQRRTLTEGITKAPLSTFIDHVRSRSKPCGECRRFFLGTP